MTAPVRSPIALFRQLATQVTTRSHHVSRRKREEKKNEGGEKGFVARTVEPHVLGERNAHGRLETQLPHEIPYGKRALVDGPRVETQVRGVEDGKEPPLLDNLPQGHPLLARGVAAGGVVRAGVQQHGRPGSGGLQGPLVRGHVHGAAGRVEVVEELALEACLGEDGAVVGVGRARDQDLGRPS